MQPPINKQKVQTFVEDDDFVIKKASRQSLKIKIAMSGPSGSGKTLGALLVAYGLCPDWNKIGFLDTENESASYYFGRDFDYRTKQGSERITIGEFHHLPLSEKQYDPQKYPNGPYHPRRFVAALKNMIKKFPSIEVIIIDSGSHEWEGLGGSLDIHSALGGQYATWGQVNPLHKEFMDCIRDLPVHIIMTMRSKSDVIIELNSKGKHAPKKIGTKSVQRDGTDYEFGIVFDIGMNHKALSSKDRTGIFAPIDMPFQLTPAVGRTIIMWAKDCIAAEPIRDQIGDQENEIDSDDQEPLVKQETKKILWKLLDNTIKKGLIDKDYSINKLHNVPDGLTESKCQELIVKAEKGDYSFFINPDIPNDEDELPF